MSYEEKKREAAIRLFGALSGVDETYLAACETNRDSNRNKPGIASFARRYGRAVAAVLTLAVLGASLLVYQTSNRKGGIDYCGENAADMDGAYTNGAMAGDAAAPEAAPEAGNLEEAQEPRTTSSMKSETNGEGAEHNVLQSAGGAASQEDKQDSIGQEITQLEAAKLAVVGDYLPEVWPARGSISQISCNDTAGEETLTVRWSYGDDMDGFELSILKMGDARPATVEDVSKPESYDASLYVDAVFLEKDFTKECVKARVVADLGDNGDTVSFRGSFGVLYQTADGTFVLVRFNGVGVVDEIWGMMESIDGQN